MPGIGLNLGPDSLLSLWARLGSNRAGRWLFSQLAGWAIPYTGSISPRVEVLRKGHAQVLMKDTRAVRNHLNSIHAIALANLGEFVTGLSVVSSLAGQGRAILKSIHADYLKKARGALRAQATCPMDFLPNEPVAQRSVLVTGEVFDAAGDCVARITAEWVVGPRKP